MTLIGSGTITRKLVGSASLNTLSPTTVGGIEIDLLEGGDSASSFGGESPATVQITVRKDTNDNWVANNPILAAGEIGYIIEDKQFFVGDGTTAYIDLTDANYIVHWDDFISALNSFDGRFTSIESNVSTLQSDVSTLQSNLESSNTFLSQLQEGLNDAVADISSLQSDISSEASTRSTAVTSLQGQIDALSATVDNGVMKKWTLEIPCEQIDGIADMWIDVITPTSGKTLLPITGNAQIINSTHLSSGGCGFKVSASIQDIELFAINGVDDIATPSPSVIFDKNQTTQMYVDEPIKLMITFVGSFTGSDGTLKINIFYMEV